MYTAARLGLGAEVLRLAFGNGARIHLILWSRGVAEPLRWNTSPFGARIDCCMYHNHRHYSVSVVCDVYWGHDDM